MSNTRRSPRRLRLDARLLVAIVALAVLAPLAERTPESAPEPADAVLVAASSAHPYSDPTWYPLRYSEMEFWSQRKHTDGSWSSLVACVYSNCTHKSNSPHGYWAIDFAGDHGDPVFAAGAGRFHVGSRDPSCATKGGGAWAWIDHGGGVVSRYHHLSTMAVEDGTLVTPATKIGTMGPGRERGCGSYYLHFEVRRNGLLGDRYNMGPLKACRPEGRVQYPKALDEGFRTWNDIPWRDRVGAIPRGGSGCVPSVPATPRRPAWTKGKRGNDMATISWSAPSRRSNRITISVQVYRSSMGTYSRPTYRVVSGSARSTTFKRLTGGRSYRFRVAFHNKHGNSAWGPKTVVTPY